MSFHEDMTEEALVDQVIAQCTCEICHSLFLEHAPLALVYGTVYTDVGTPVRYSLKHSRYWRVCEWCALELGRSKSERRAGLWRWVLPNILNLGAVPDMRELFAVQPMAQPQGHVFYMDYVYNADVQAVNAAVNDVPVEFNVDLRDMERRLLARYANADADLALNIGVDMPADHG